ncbi:MAG: hypothetical protein JSW67_13700 [Candidatus Latescibacterota bacterium]|nr:MAG: hypothetical protein JSW67_13700 [Candidatus Latescibacterota bacterium]
MRWALLQGVLLAVLALLLLSPLLRVRTVVWTGSIPVEAARYQAVERASLGQPLALLPESELLELLGVDHTSVRVALKRHPPATLEVCLVPRHALARTAAGVAFDAAGRKLAARHTSSGLPLALGFAPSADGRAVGAADAALIARVLSALGTPALAPARIERQGRELLLTLARGVQVRLHAQQLERELRKLVLFEHSLGTAELPPQIDLRYRDQIVIEPRAEEVSHVSG